MLRIALSFVLAVAVAVAAGSLVQTQFNLAAIQGVGVDIPFQVRVAATLHDLGSFTPLYAAIVAIAFVPAFLVAAWIVRRRPQQRVALFAVTAAASLLVVFLVADALAPMPTLIGATRTITGTLAMLLTAALAAALFALMAWRVR